MLHNVQLWELVQRLAIHLVDTDKPVKPPPGGGGFSLLMHRCVVSLELDHHCEIALSIFFRRSALDGCILVWRLVCKELNLSSG